MAEHTSHPANSGSVLRQICRLVAEALHQTAVAQQVYFELVQDFDREFVDPADPDRIRWAVTPSGWKLRGRHLPAEGEPEAPGDHEAA